jgi:hypothetical protein
MQRVTNAMADIVLMFINLFLHVCSFCGDILATIEKQWSNEENPLFFLAFILHLRYQLAAKETVRLSSQNHGTWTERKNPLSTTRLLSAAVFYYKKFELFQLHATPDAKQEETQKLRKHLTNWLTKPVDQLYIAYDI